MRDMTKANGQAPEGQHSRGNSLYMSANEVAEALGISVSTVYTYVTRKMLRSEKAAGSRIARYFRSDVVRLQRRTSSARFSGNTLAPQANLIDLDDGGPRYRGQSAIHLAREGTLESVARLLWQVPDAFDGPAPTMFDDLSRMDALSGSLTAADRALPLFMLIENTDHRALDLTPQGSARTAAAAIRWFTSWVVHSEAPDDAPVHIQLTQGRPDGEYFREFVRKLVVIGADHPLDPTVFAVRSAANTGISPYRSIMTGLIASAGRRLTFARQESILRLIGEVISSPNPSDIVVGRLREGEILPGFSDADEIDDPRVHALLADLRSTYSDDVEVARLLSCIDTVAELDRRRATISLIHLFIGQRLGLGRERGMILRLARMVGWIAHAIEQYNGTETGMPLPPAAAAGNLVSR